MPNLCAKLPVVEEGLEAIEAVAADGIAINSTEIMAVRQALDVVDIYSRVCKKIRKPAPFYYSVITGIFDEYMYKHVEENNIDVSKDALWQAGIVVARKIYQMVNDRRTNCQYIGGGARGLHHFTEMVGAECIVTINWNGTAETLIEQDPPIIQRFRMPTPCSVEQELVEKLKEFRRAYFVDQIERSEYHHYGPVVLFRETFEAAWESAKKAVSDRRKGF